VTLSGATADHRTDSKREGPVLPSGDDHDQQNSPHLVQWRLRQRRHVAGDQRDHRSVWHRRVDCRAQGEHAMNNILPAHLATRIEWAQSTFNPWVGCQHVSDGCQNCYAERDNKFRQWTAGGAWGPHAERTRTSADYWRTPLRLAKRAREGGERYRIFCAPLADWLGNQVPQQWRIDLAEVIRATPELDWLLLTKRIENYDRFAPWAQAPDNVWLGVTAENQKEYDRRWPLLARIPAVVRFVSHEPALTP